MSHRIASLDGLRAISIALVFAAHLVNTDHYPHNVVTDNLLQYGSFGVQVFFVLSGYLITTLLTKERERTGRLDLRGFYQRRAYRILPASLVYTTLAVMGCFVVGEHLGFQQLVVIYGFSVGYFITRVNWVFGHLWSLGVEEQFYLLWPISIALWWRGRSLIAAGVFVASALCRAHGGFGPVNHSFPNVADQIAAGCLFAIYTPRLLRLPRWCWSTPVTLSLCAAAVVMVPFIHTRNALYWGIEPLLVAAAMFALIQNRPRLLNNRPMAYVGVLSYALYLAQQPFLDEHVHTALTAFPVNLICSVAAALALHYLVEQPMLRLGAARRSRRAAAHASPVGVAG